MKLFTFLLSFLIISYSHLSAQSVVDYAGQAQSAGSTMTSTLKDKAKFNAPYGIAMDKKGNMHITEEGNHTLTVIASNGYTVIRAGGVGMPSFVDATGTTSRFASPHGIVAGLNNELYVCDYDNCVIRKVGKFDNFGSNQVVTVYSGKYSIQGSYYKASPGYADGSAKTAQFDGPTDIDIDASGNLYVADRNNHCIRKIATDGSVTTLAGVGKSPGNADGPANQAKFNTPMGVFVDGSDVYVADRGNSAIRKISNGQVTTVTTDLFLPNDVVKIGNDLYIADQCRIKKYSNGTVTLFAGGSANNDCGYVSGSGTNARFTEIFSLLVYNNNELLIPDRNNHVIRLILDCSSYKPTITQSGNELIAESGSAYQWYRGGYPLQGASNQKYTPTQTGDYQCEVTGDNGCQALSNSIHVEISSIDNYLPAGMTIYPNPATSKLFIQWNEQPNDFSQIEIFDVLGNKIITKKLESNLEIDLNSVKSGMYFIQISHNNKLFTSRFIKQ